MSPKDKERDELVDEARKKNDAVFDIDSQKKVLHNWIDRGLKLSCEDAGHPPHQSWKKRRIL